MEENYNQQNQVVPPATPAYANVDSNQVPPMKPANWLWQSIVVTLLCCLPFGIVGIIYAAKVDSLYNSGRYEESVKASKNAKKWTLVALAAFLIYCIVLIIMFTTGNMPDYMESLIENSSSYNY